ncbi:hypothetical protein QP028_02135 [Corynebacterium suedekumii]|nr:hypothetical protein QP028_02135 [Corynebacterium suedekumii]
MDIILTGELTCRTEAEMDVVREYASPVRGADPRRARVSGVRGPPRG